MKTEKKEKKTDKNSNGQAETMDGAKSTDDDAVVQQMIERFTMGLEADRSS